MREEGLRPPASLAQGTRAGFPRSFGSGEGERDHRSRLFAKGGFAFVRKYGERLRVGRQRHGDGVSRRHTRLDREGATKLLPSERLHNEQAVSRFEREMKAIGRSHHP